MNVDKITGTPVRIDALNRAQGSAGPQSAAEPASPARGSDAVEISDAGLALASDGTSSRSASSIDPARADQIRSRILSGAYNSLGMADQVARAVIRSGDI